LTRHKSNSPTKISKSPKQQKTGLFNAEANELKKKAERTNQIRVTEHRGSLLEELLQKVPRFDDDADQNQTARKLTNADILSINHMELLQKQS
jgi:hypothetical protein